MASLDCSSDASGDLYGLGVRLGIYLIWLASYLANTFLPGEISGTLDANAIFLLALMASIFRGTVLHGTAQLRFVDGLILMQLCSGYLFGCFSIWGYRTVHYYREGRRGTHHFGHFGTHCRLILATAISAYGVWFWTEGIEDGLAPLTDDQGNFRAECYPLVTFFFAKLDVKGPIRGWYTFITVACTAYYGIMCVVAAIERISRAWGAKALFTKGTYETGLTRKELRYIYLFCRVGNALWIVYCVLMVEITLNWNHVAEVVGVNGKIATPSQLLPLLIGALGCVRTFYLLYREYRPQKKNDEETALQPPKTDNAGLGLVMEKQSPDSSTVVPDDGDDLDLNVQHRSLALRYLVAWLPWLSVSELWKRPTTNRAHASTQKREDSNPHDSRMPLMATTPATPGNGRVDQSAEVSHANLSKNSPSTTQSPVALSTKRD